MCVSVRLFLLFSCVADVGSPLFFFRDLLSFKYLNNYFITRVCFICKSPVMHPSVTLKYFDGVLSFSVYVHLKM